jgi:hypothetical protein
MILKNRLSGTYYGPLKSGIGLMTFDNGSLYIMEIGNLVKWRIYK